MHWLPDSSPAAIPITVLIKITYLVFHLTIANTVFLLTTITAFSDPRTRPFSLLDNPIARPLKSIATMVSDMRSPVTITNHNRVFYLITVTSFSGKRLEQSEAVKNPFVVSQSNHWNKAVMARLRGKVPLARNLPNPLNYGQFCRLLRMTTMLIFCGVSLR
jgi:PHD/YefM family antitoxin component YafN of YafNO toxin-antitoxin module